MASVLSGAATSYTPPPRPVVSEPITLAIRYNGVVRRFAMPRNVDKLLDIIRQEFFLSLDSPVGLTLSSQQGADDFMIIPFDADLLARYSLKSPDIIYDLRVYPSPSESAYAHVPLQPNQVVSLYDYQGASQRELSFAAGTVIDVIGQYNADWYKGRIGALTGFFPANYVKGLENCQLEAPVHASQATEAAEGDWQDPEYFESYANLNIHLEMLSDLSRTTTYKKAIENVKDIKDKVVLDIGCGSGILSAFCALAGAKHVYAVDASDVILEAEKVIKENNLQDKVTLLRGKIEDINLPCQVDMIVSEWMGTMLICESMISSVLNVRPKLLKEGGLMLPSTSDIFMSPLCLDEFYGKKIHFWDNVYGVKMSSLKAKAHKEFFSNPLFDRIAKPEELLSEAVNVFHLDMHKDTSDVLEKISTPFRFVVNRGGVLHAFGTWFDSGFAASPEEEDSIVLSTSPFHPPTHWKNVTFVMEEQVLLEQGTEIVGTYIVRRHKQWLRHFEVTIEYEVVGKDLKIQQTFPLWR